MSTPTLPDLPPAFEYLYVWSDGARKLTIEPRNGMQCETAYLMYTAAQMRAYARATIIQTGADERNFCSRCGKRLGNTADVHTCTPPI